MRLGRPAGSVRDGCTYFAIEGIDGSGKTTISRILARELSGEGYSVSLVGYTSRSGVLGRLINLLYISDGRRGPILDLLRSHRFIQALLFAVNGRLNLARRDKGAGFLISDRSVLTGFASHRHCLPGWFITAIEPRLVPDVIFYLDVDPEVALARIAARPGVRFEDDSDWLYRFRANYDSLVSALPRRFKRCTIVRVPAARSVPEVTEVVLTAIHCYIA